MSIVREQIFLITKITLVSRHITFTFYVFFKFIILHFKNHNLFTIIFTH